eukprot:3067775-Rhodomonas_salina.3
MAADLQQTLDEIEFEQHAPIPAPDRRGEMTPGRVVHFEPAAMTSDRGGSKLGFGGGARHFSMSPLTSTGAGVGMSPIAKQRALSAAEIKIKLLEKALQQKKPSRYSTLSTGSDMDERDTSFALAKLEKPQTFK